MDDFTRKLDKEGMLREVEGQTFTTKPTATVIIPICCREGWDSCPHVSKPQRKVKNNIGL